MGKKKKEKKPRKPRDPNKPRKPPTSDNNLILAKLRSAFSRSSFHRAVLDALVVEHSDPERPRVKTWCKCPLCGKPDARSYFQVDHIEPVRPIGVHVDDMGKHQILDRVFCLMSNLQGLCPRCHHAKTTAENAVRKKLRDAAKKACGSDKKQAIVTGAKQGES